MTSQSMVTQVTQSLTDCFRNALDQLMQGGLQGSLVQLSE